VLSAIALAIASGAELAHAAKKKASGKTSQPKKLRALRPAEPGGPQGTTMLFALDNAPFADRKYNDGTVLVYVPSHYRLPKSGAVDMVVHFHGHRSTAERSANGHVLRQQLDDSMQNAILVVPQLAVMTPDSSAGRLEDAGGLERLLKEVVREARRDAIGSQLGASSLAGASGAGVVCISAHSGGYHAAAECLKHGGLDVRECWLFDALLDHVDVFESWVVSAGKARGTRHKLISFHAGGDITAKNMELLALLQKRGVDCRQEKKPGELTRNDLTQAHAVFITTPLGHSSTTFAQNNLRDCLFSSSFKRLKKSNWFADKNSPRKLDHRAGG
jgi:hypothetical protein